MSNTPESIAAGLTKLFGDADALCEFMDAEGVSFDFDADARHTWTWADGQGAEYTFQFTEDGETVEPVDVRLAWSEYDKWDIQAESAPAGLLDRLLEAA